ncbi:HAD family hydrolase [Paenibacillus sp. N3/727]|uniref:HAD family hydrolase n=1 Tax=Paenibacillus sp. N3/727 TaxID=2925845 RepID=UPI001F52EDEF|nr:HAD family hydrolase [Paenibacillus sp. N3/727]UNK16371.1 HAD family hydrolase [Paenibacillus sp. N3/727]
MKNIKCIFFDCMETIVDLFELPTSSDYARWTYANSGVEHYWHNFDDFLEKYNIAKKSLSDSCDTYQEYELKQRIEVVVNTTESIKQDKKEVTNRLYDNYWNTYKSKCFIKEEVRVAVLQLKEKYRLAIVSNFMVMNGIEELLIKTNMRNNFEFIVSSIGFGWRKPDPRIYKYAIDNSGCEAQEILFIGDDYENDYVAPRKSGMNSLWLNKFHKKRDDIDQVHDFYEITQKLLG